MIELQTPGMIAPLTIHAVKARTNSNELKLTSENKINRGRFQFKKKTGRHISVN